MYIIMVIVIVVKKMDREYIWLQGRIGKVIDYSLQTLESKQLK